MAIKSFWKMLVKVRNTLKILSFKSQFNWSKSDLNSSDFLSHAQYLFRGKSKQEKFPAQSSSSAFNCFDWLRSWIEAADWWMVPKFAGFLN